MIFLSKGNVKLDSKTFETKSDGECIIVGEMNPDTMEVKEPIQDFYADWNASGWLGKVLELMQPTRPDNLPPLRQIVEDSMEDRTDDGNALCDYCTKNRCETCIVREWVDEYRERENEKREDC